MKKSVYYPGKGTAQETICQLIVRGSLSVLKLNKKKVRTLTDFPYEQCRLRELWNLETVDLYPSGCTMLHNNKTIIHRADCFHAWMPNGRHLTKGKKIQSLFQIQITQKQFNLRGKYIWHQLDLVLQADETLSIMNC